MQIKVKCANGHSLAAKEELAGRTLKCPKCGLPTLITPFRAEVVEATDATQSPFGFPAFPGDNDAFESALPQRPDPHGIPLSESALASSTAGYWQPMALSTETTSAAPSKRKAKKNREQIELTGGLFVVSIFALLAGVASILVAMALLAINAAPTEQFKALYLHERATFLLIAVQVLLSGVCLLAGGIGILAKQVWGWLLVTIFWTFSLTERLLTLCLLMLTGLPAISMGTRLLAAFFSATFVIYLFSDDTREAFGVPKKLPLVAGGVGVFYAVLVLSIVASIVQ